MFTKRQMENLTKTLTTGENRWRIDAARKLISTGDPEAISAVGLALQKGDASVDFVKTTVEALREKATRMSGQFTRKVTVREQAPIAAIACALLWKNERYTRPAIDALRKLHEIKNPALLPTLNEAETCGINQIRDGARRVKTEIDIPTDEAPKIAFGLGSLKRKATKSQLKFGIKHKNTGLL